MGELLALLRTALDSESSDYEEIYPLFTQCRRDCDLETLVQGQEGDRDYDVFLCKSSSAIFSRQFF